MSQDTPKIFCAIDTSDINEATKIAKTAGRATGAVKLGLTFFNQNGPAGIRQVVEASGNPALFLDLKCHDIPMQVAGAVKSVVSLAPMYLTIHTSGGAEMMRQAAEAARQEAERQGVPRLKLLGITVLTSLDDDGLSAVGQSIPAADQVTRLAKLAKESGLDGVVCSPREVELVRQACGPDFDIVVPGIRPAGASLDDQARVMTPDEAVVKGASHLVIGRPITRADDPQAAADAIQSSIDEALAQAA